MADNDGAAGEPQVSDDAARSRYQITVDGAVAGFVEYHLDGDVIAFIHTEIDDRYSGQGLASALIRGSLDSARARGLAVQPVCSFVRRYIAEHEQYLDLVPAQDRARFELS